MKNCLLSLLTLSVLLTCCNSTENIEGQTVEITGQTENAKDGAVIYTEDGTYVVIDKRRWESDYLNKTVKATVKVVSDNTIKESDLVTEDGEYMQGRAGRTFSVKLVEVQVIE